MDSLILFGIAGYLRKRDGGGIAFAVIVKGSPAETTFPTKRQCARRNRTWKIFWREIRRLSFCINAGHQVLAVNYFQPARFACASPCASKGSPDI
jgi:hypothetical protein